MIFLIIVFCVLIGGWATLSLVYNEAKYTHDALHTMRIVVLFALLTLCGLFWVWFTSLIQGVF